MDNVEMHESAARQHQNMPRNTRKKPFIEYWRIIIKSNYFPLQKLKFKLEETMGLL